MPEKSGMDAADWVPLVADPTAGATVCPKAGVATAAINVTNKGKSRCRALMISSPSWFARPHVCGHFIFYFKDGKRLTPAEVVELFIRPAGARDTRDRLQDNRQILLPIAFCDLLDEFGSGSD